MSFTADQLKTLRGIVPQGVSDNEFNYFVAACERTGLDPFARQIYMSERSEKRGNDYFKTYRPETTIDGFRIIAQRTGKYGGQIGPHWCGKDGKWVEVWLVNEPPAAARVGIIRTDFREPLFAVALYSEYAQTNRDGGPNLMWKKMPANQLAKCAESGGLRKAFPNDLSGLYTHEEMGQASNPEPEQDRPLPQRASDAQATSPVVAPPQPAPRPTTPPGPANGANTIQVSCVISSISSRSGVTNGREWTIFEFASEGGEVYKTFNKDIAAAAEILKGKHVKLVLESTTTKGGQQRTTVIDILHEGEDEDGPGPEDDGQMELS